MRRVPKWTRAEAATLRNIGSIPTRCFRCGWEVGISRGLIILGKLVQFQYPATISSAEEYLHCIDGPISGPSNACSDAAPVPEDVCLVAW